MLVFNARLESEMPWHFRNLTCINWFLNVYENMRLFVRSWPFPSFVRAFVAHSFVRSSVRGPFLRLFIRS